MAKYAQIIRSIRSSTTITVPGVVTHCTLTMQQSTSKQSMMQVSRGQEHSRSNTSRISNTLEHWEAIEPFVVAENTVAIEIGAALHSGPSSITQNAAEQNALEADQPTKEASSHKFAAVAQCTLKVSCINQNADSQLQQHHKMQVESVLQGGDQPMQRCQFTEMQKCTQESIF